MEADGGIELFSTCPALGAFPDGYLAVGVIQQELVRSREAVAAYRRYLALAPDGLYASTIARQLRRLEEEARREGADRARDRASLEGP